MEYSVTSLFFARLYLEKLFGENKNYKGESNRINEFGQKSAIGNMHGAEIIIFQFLLNSRSAGTG